jgi:hypothetical protein
VERNTVKIDITRNVPTRETIDVDFPYYYRDDLGVDETGMLSVVYGRIDREHHVGIRVYSSEEIYSEYRLFFEKVEVEHLATLYNRGSLFSPERRSNAEEFAEVCRAVRQKAEMLRLPSSPEEPPERCDDHVETNSSRNRRPAMSDEPFTLQVLDDYRALLKACPITRDYPIMGIVEERQDKPAGFLLIASSQEELDSLLEAFPDKVGEVPIYARLDTSAKPLSQFRDKG